MSTYAIIQTGSKQYTVREGDELDVELLESENTHVFDKVVLVHNGQTVKIGAPYVAKCTVQATIVAQTKGPKVIAFKYKKCKNYRRLVGHRQKYSRVKITKISHA